DPGQIQETREVIRAFGEHHAVLFSTHILAEVTLICRRVAIIIHGRLLAIDSPSALRRAQEETHRVSLQVSGPSTEVRDALLSVKGVIAVDVHAMPDNAGLLAVDCRVEPRQGLEAAIARAVTHRWDLHRPMRLFSAEFSAGTAELLLTLPLEPWQIVVAKYLGAVTILVLMTAATVVDLVPLYLFGTPETTTILAGYVGFVLLGMACLALGLFFSTLTHNQIVAALITAAVL